MIKFVISICLSVLFALPSLAQTVTRDGNEWLQPADFTSLSWTDVVAICPAPNYECSGTLNSTDVTGYTFASIAEVTALLNSYIDTSTPLTSAPDQTPVTNAEFDALRTDFLATTIDGEVRGQSSTVSVQNNNWPRGGDARGAIDSRRFQTSSVYNPDVAIDNAGHWFYRPATTQPGPGPQPTAIPTLPFYGLVVTALGLLFIAFRRMSRRMVR